MTQPVALSTLDGVAVITIDNPPVNALSPGVPEGILTALDAAERDASVRAIVLITTHKVYENREWEYSYREVDPLGGHDPYSASKASAVLTAASRYFFSPQLS